MAPRQSSSRELWTASLACLMMSALTATGQSLPKIDFDALGSVGIAGNFAGLQIWDEDYARTYKALNRSGEDSSSLWTRTASNGHLEYLGSTDARGRIVALCQSDADDGLLYLGGSFTSINGTDAQNIASYDPKARTFAALDSGLDGPVLALACDTESDTLWVGGTFAAPVDASDSDSYGGSVASWSMSDKAWSSLPFGGFDGAVLSIRPAGTSDDDHSIFFGGNFTLSISATNSSTSSGSSSSNSSADDYASLGSALAPIPISDADVWAGPGDDSGDPSTLLCPEGDGQSGSEYLTPGREAAIIVVRTDDAHQVGGLRIGNTFQNNRGTSQFKVISIPDSVVQTLTYLTDPTDPDSDTATCSWECPLSDDSSVLYEDFLFQSGTNITGFQIDLDGFYGNGAGLHQLTLLSTGGVAYAASNASSSNANACASGVGQAQSSSSSQTGDWATTSIASSIDDVTETALTASVDADASQSDSPSVTFSPTIVSDTEYDVYLITPGCSQMDDCDARTSVEVSTDNGSGGTDSATVSQTNENTQSALVYSGDLSPGATFTLRLAEDPEGSGSGGQYTLVAYKIQAVARDTSAPRVQDKPGRALYEYVPEGSQGSFHDGDASASSNTNITGDPVTNATAFTSLSTSLNASEVLVQALVFSDDVVYFGGAFNSSDNITTANVASFDGNTNSSIPNGGLNGPVTALLVLSDWLYAAGSFSASADGAVSDLKGLARWKIGSTEDWSALTGGDAPSFTEVSGLTTTKLDKDDAVVVISSSAQPLAVYNTKSEQWDSDALPFISGSASAVVAGKGNKDDDDDNNTILYFAGQITQALSSTSSGASQLKANSSGYPSLQSYGFDVSGTSSSSASSDSATSSSASSSQRVKRATRTFTKRATTSFTSLPTPVVNDADSQILAAAYYTNHSDHLVLLGGHFQGENSTNNLAAFSTDSNEVQPLADGNSIDGTVRTLLVVDDTLWIGGQFATEDGSGGLIRYELDSGTWSPLSSNMHGYEDTNVTVTSLLTTSAKSKNVIIGGSFASVGSLSCASICSYDSENNQWNSFGAGLNGIVAALDFGGDDSRYIFAAGSFELDGQDVYAARWDTKELQWSVVGDANALPGPATAIATDDQDEQKIFAAGVSSDEAATPYFMKWDGTTWSDLSSDALQSGSEFQQIAFVPLSNNRQDNHDDLVEKDRLLMVSGDLDFEEYGRVSSALFDGSSWTPFLVSAAAGGDSGFIAGLFYSAKHFTLSHHYLSVGIVILISIAIALGVVFLLVLVGLLVALKNRKADQKAAAYPAAGRYNGSDDEIHEKGRRPTSLLATLNAATALVAADGATKNQQAKRETGPSQYDDDSTDDHDLSTAALGGAAMAHHPSSSSSEDDEDQFYDDEGEEIVRMRYSFEAEQQGELTVNANEELRVIDKTSEEWYFAEKLDGSNERGVVPASFLY